MENFPIAAKRIQNISDPGSFEIYPKKVPCNILTGFCKIDRRTVGIFSQEPTHSAGAMGLVESQLLCALMDKSLEKKYPVIGLLHSAGAKIQEGVDSLAGYAEVFKRNVRLSGIVPQISLVLGTCAGGAVYSPALTDFILISKDGGEMFITGPDVIRQTTGEVTDRKGLGGSEIHFTKSGVAHLLAKEENSAGTLLRKLLSFIPSNCEENAPIFQTEDDLNRENPDLETISKEDKRKAYDVRQVIESIADRETFLEIQSDFAKNIVIGFARMGGTSVSFVANNSSHLAGALDIQACTKAARFIRFCDSFNVPIITLVDVPGYWPGIEQEHFGIIRHGAKLLYAYAELESPCITVILRKAYGGAYCVMGSKQCCPAVNFAWPTAEIAVMGPSGAVEILFKRGIELSQDPEKFKREKTEEYIHNVLNPDLALKKNYIDKIIKPSQTRKEILKTLKVLLKNYEPHFKHKNIPL